jgi:hypothetical protein
METVLLKVTSAFFIGGKMARPGDVVEVPTSDARDLLNRGKARLAEVAAAGPQADEATEDRVGLVETDADEQPRRRRGKRSE